MARASASLNKLESLDIFIVFSTFCHNSSTICDFVMDKDNFLMEMAIWKDESDSLRITVGNRFCRMQTLMKSTIIVRLSYKSSMVNIKTLSARTTFSDKIANLGGTFGIWAELIDKSFYFDLQTFIS